MTTTSSELYIDIETYSETDIRLAGLYPYVEDPAFEVLLIAYAWNDEPVKLLDLAGGDYDPWERKKLGWYLTDPAVLKIAHNNPFERTALGSWVNAYLPPEEWDDTMIRAAYNGLPMSLDEAGAALNIERKKLKSGTALINYFCKPCAPTKANGGRTRNRPEHAPDKWQTFKEYCVRDVEAMRQIRKRLKGLPVMPKWERTVWCMDARINERGVLIDRQLAEAAVAMDGKFRAECEKELAALTGLENPNSVAQLKGWLNRVGADVESLNKATVTELRQSGLSQHIDRALELRQLLGKTSVKKYQAMLDSVCKDGRIRGITQYYGTRTGRWCLTGDHEVLTEDGWQRLDSWTGGKILCWSPAAEALSFQKSERVVFDYHGPMITFTGQRIEQIATPEHKMAVLGKDGRWEPKEASQLTGRFTIPFTGKRLPRGYGNGDTLRVLIMTQADGYYTADGCVRYHFIKLRKIERCKRLLRRAGIPFVTDQYGATTRIRIPAQCVPLWLRQFRDKTFGYWLLDEDPAVLFDELCEWDGYRCGPNSIQYSSTNERNVDVLQACAHCAGLSATKLRKNKSNDNWNDSYILNVWLTPGRGTSIRKEQIGRVNHEGPVYCAVTPTGYFAVRRNGKVWITGNSGRKVQLQNLPQNHLADIADVREIAKAGDLDGLEMLYDSVPDTLSQLIRTAFIAKPGHTLLVADYSAIEARVIAFLAGEEWRQEVFAKGGDIYCASASRMFKVPVEKHGVNAHLRQKGKIAELALGYGGGVNALKAFGADKMGLSEAEMEEIVSSWREASPLICKFWRNVEAAARTALENPGRAIKLNGGTIRFQRDSDALRCTLPSGRTLTYWGAGFDEDGNIVFMGQNQVTRKWERISTWGGKLVENIVQAFARDCLATAMLRLDEAGYQIVFHVHDEIICEMPEGSRWEEMAEIMGQPIDWAPRLLLRAEGYSTPFYLKD